MHKGRHAAGLFPVVSLLVVSLLFPSAGAAADPIPESGLAAARSWFQRHAGSSEAMTAYSTEEKAKRLTQAVYSFCEDGTQPADPDQLFDRCTAACGGRSYVLRGLLEAIGVETRFAELYNIPNQGNHTAIEVKVGQGWSLFDPTFGAYFAPDGSVEANALSLQDVAYRYPKGSLGGHVLQARKEPMSFATDKLQKLFDGKFDHQFMSLENYQVAEQITTGEEGFSLSLDIPLTLSNGEGGIGAREIADIDTLSKQWLSATNDTLNDDDPLNDVSYNSSILASGEIRKTTTLSLFGLEAGHRYELELILHGEGADDRIQVIGIGKGVEYAAVGGIDLGDKSVKARNSFVPLRDTAQFRLRNMSAVGQARVLGIRVREADGRTD
ncbi:transglutaminase domain-containing protein [Aureimonas leprariae]|uniref:Transglutaminase domain-containing protein n=1 Tax=Plantimonas leprariae TaxID=2615207 RepID=A0A7V7PK52_9HYPH|nr:transglutaminase domain-containing protein [Aureimonas leprariae]KAB0675908.1 transglutaminase domain-containing protein [Aureimonas leprariae]